MNCAKRIFAVMVILLLSYFVVGEVLLASDNVLGENRCEVFDGDWFWVQGDGSKTSIEIPGKYDIARNELMTIETVLPDDIPYNSYMCFRSGKQELDIYVDGVLRKQYSTEDTRLFGKISAVAYVFLELTPEDAGKTLTLDVRTDSSYSGILYSAYYGDMMGIWKYFFKQYGAEIIVAFLAVILGMVSIVAGAILRKYYRKEIVLEYLGWGVFVAAVWLISNSVFRQLISPNLSVINDMAFLALMVLPLPLTIYMNGIQKRRYERWYKTVSNIIIADFVVCTGLHILKLVDFTDTIVYMAIVDSFAICCMGITIANDIKKHYIKEYFWVAMGILASVAAAFAQMVMYFRRDTAFSGMILAIGLILLLLFAVVNTIHEILQMERDRQRALLSSEMKGKFLANMSHEIRTPINAVLGMNAMVLRESTDIKIKEYALDIQNASQNLLSIINDILDFSKIESGKMEIIPVEYDFSSMIHDIVNMISIKAASKDLKLEVYVDENLPSRLKGDDVRIRQILVNLMNNGVKYTEQGSVTLRVSGEIREEKVFIDFCVEDTGIGIKEEDINKLFKAFERIEESRNRHIEGSGLGMSIVFQLLELMGSKLDVDSVYGKGTKFSFLLEQEVLDEKPIGNLAERIKNQAIEYHYDVAFTAPDAHVLVVDDNPVNRKVFINLLKETMVQIDEASGGMECLEKIRQNKYDVIFLDHMMPDMDGIETLRHIKSEDEHFCMETPIISMTANAISGAREMYLAEGFDDFVSKPINPEKLEYLLMDILPEDKVVYHKKENADAQNNSSISFPDIDGIDWEYALLHTKDKSVLQAAVNDYYLMIDAEGDALEKYFEDITVDDVTIAEEALRQYRIKVHGMKSSAAMIGAVNLSGLAKMLEYAARDNRKDIICSVTPHFLEQWRNYKELLKPCIRMDNDEVKETVDRDTFMELLNSLNQAMDEMDIDMADEIMKKIKQINCSDDCAAVIDGLGAAVINIDGDMVSECIHKLKMLMG